MQCTCVCVGRVTITMNERDHLALKILALHKRTKIVAIIQDAMREYPDKEGAYDLAILSTKSRGESL